ncbi:MAG: energy transducer TonB [Tissierellia bacterium]|nr:energy transducer TonB [Tissierellia bacterium]
MRKAKILTIILIAMIFISCSLSNRKMEVSIFVEQFIRLYINDDLNVDLSPKNHIIKVLIEDNENGYYVTVIGYEKSFLTSSDSSYFGCSVFEKYDVFFYGKQLSEFVTGDCSEVRKSLLSDTTGGGNNIEYDPIEFRISLLKNLEFDKMHSFKGNINTEVDDFKVIVDTYLKRKGSVIIDANKEEVYSNVQQIARFEPGIDSLLSIVYCNPMFKEIKELNFTEQKVIIRFVVTKEGEVKEPEIISGSGNKEIDRTIENIVRKFPKILPAKHRKEIVNSYLTIPIKLPSAN